MKQLGYAVGYKLFKIINKSKSLLTDSEFKSSSFNSTKITKYYSCDNSKI